MANKKKHIVRIGHNWGGGRISIPCGATIDVSDAGLEANMALPIDDLCKRCFNITRKYGDRAIRMSAEVKDMLRSIQDDCDAGYRNAQTAWAKKHLAETERNKALAEAKEAYDLAVSAANRRFVEQFELHPEYAEANQTLSSRRQALFDKAQEARVRVDVIVMERFVEATDEAVRQVINKRQTEVSLS